ncbi:MAG: beta-propeller fold lactonase family protein [Piscinibacter sp.]|nr:beta-propeller fold lactonase family protein [Piscinibacter sp.]
MNHTRRRAFQLFGLGVAAGGLGLPALAHDRDDGDEDDDGARAGRIFTATNAAAGNEVLVLGAGAGGALALLDRVATQGQGSGAGLGNQGGVTLSGSGRYLFVVNAASHTVSTFAVRRRGLVLRSVVASGGLQPISVTEHRGIVVVLNADGAGNVAGFVNLGGRLRPLPGATQPLSAAGGVGPAQVGFSPDGDVLLVTEKATNKLTTYRVRHGGRIDAPVVTASAGVTPFGFAFDRRGHALVSEAFGGAAGASALSSYGFEDWGSATPSLISGSVGTTQTAACWVAVSADGRSAYTTNTGSNSISRFTVHRSGRVELAEAAAAASDAGPIDAAVSGDGERLFVLTAGGHSIDAYRIAHDGRLSAAGRIGDLPAGTNGLAAN